MHKLNTVTQIREFPVLEDDEETKRPYRIWNADEKKEVRWACFKNLRHAHLRALEEAAWSTKDAKFELFDKTTGGLRGQYYRRGQDIKFWRSHHSLEEQ